MKNIGLLLAVFGNILCMGCLQILAYVGIEWVVLAGLVIGIVIFVMGLVLWNNNNDWGGNLLVGRLFQIIGIITLFTGCVSIFAGDGSAFFGIIFTIFAFITMFVGDWVNYPMHY